MLNRNQKAAVTCTDKHILCLAGPGTGKTYTLIERILHLVDDGVAPSSILALTFTNVAAFEMKARFEAARPKAEVPEFRTFHSFCYHILATDKAVLKLVGYAKVPEVADEAMQKRITKEAMIQTGISLPEKKIFGHEVLTQQEAYNLMLILKATDRLMKKKGVITFNMLSKHICDLFIADAPEIKKYKEQYKYVLADEYQDTDRLQHQFITSFTDSNLFVVGDAQQALYAFRGATSQIIKDLAKDEDWTTIKLTKNYRSTKEICKYVNKFSRSYADESYRVEIESDTAGPTPITSSYLSPSRRGETPHSIIKEIVDFSQSNPGTTAILVRSNAEAAYIKNSLTDMHIPYNSSDSKSPAAAFLRCIQDDAYAVDWLSSKLPVEYYSQYIREAAIKSSRFTLPELVSRFSWSDYLRDHANKVYELRKICQTGQTITLIRDKLLKALDCKDLKVDMTEVTKNGNRLSDLIHAMIEAINDYQDSTAGLYVGTVHSVKGLEYDNVFVIGASGYSWPLNDDDNKNVFYVAVSRAKTNLTIYFAQ